MKRKRKIRRQNSTNPIQTNFFIDIVGIVLMFAAAFTLLSIVSFNTKDPSWFSATDLEARNYMGLTGAYWSSMMVHLFGYAAFVVVVLLTLAGLATLRRIRKEAVIIATVNYLILLSTSSIGLSLYQDRMVLNSQSILSGGIIGSGLGNALSAYFNIGGIVLIACFALLLALSLSLRLTVRELFANCAKYLTTFALYAFAALTIISSRLLDYSKLVLRGTTSVLQFVFGSILDSVCWFFAFMRAKDSKDVKNKLETPPSLQWMRRERIEAEEDLYSEAPPIEEPAIAKRSPNTQTPSETSLSAMAGNTLQTLRNKSPIRRDLINRLLSCLHQMGRSRGELIYAESFSSYSTTIPQDLEPTNANFQAVDETDATGLDDIQIIPRSGKKCGTKISVLEPDSMARSKSSEKRSSSGKFLSKLMGKPKYHCPKADLLEEVPEIDSSYDRQELIENSQTLEEKISDFKIKGKVTAVKPGPVITMYEFKPGTGVKVNSIANLADDLALALAAQSVRIEAPIPGRDVVGIEVPNEERESVYLKEVIDTKKFRDERLSIPIAIGKDTFGDPVVADLRKMPHMLVAGATGSGKSVFVNSLICSLLFRFNPNELKLILVDPKQLELNFYDAIPHLLVPVVTDAKQASQALRWAVNEMEERYGRIARSGMRDIDGFNAKLAEQGAEKLAKRLEEDPEDLEPMPKIVIVIDELADLMMTAKSDVENYICRLAQKARAAGIHLVLATQRPSVDVITGLIKANLPARISFRLSSKNDSRTIFDTQGAERLVGNGDMLFMPPGESRLLRMHGAYISETEIEGIADFWRQQGEPEYREEILEAEDEDGEFAGLSGDEDALLKDAIDLALSTGYVSASMVQRRLRVGYNRAARMVEQMEARGIVGPAEGSKPRPVLLQP